MSALPVRWVGYPPEEDTWEPREFDLNILFRFEHFISGTFFVKKPAGCCQRTVSTHMYVWLVAFTTTGSGQQRSFVLFLCP